MTSKPDEPDAPGCAPDTRGEAAESAAPRRARRSPRRNSSWGDALRQADEERQWRELIEHMPDNARQIWSALDDVRQFLRMLRTFGGQNVRIPRRMPRDRRHALRRALGMAGLRKLMAAFGGTNLYVPRCNALMARLRQHDIIENFTQRTRRGSSSTAAVAGLARHHGISDRRVWQILKKEGSAPVQARLLFKLGGSSQSAAVITDNIP